MNMSNTWGSQTGKESQGNQGAAPIQGPRQA